MDLRPTVEVGEDGVSRTYVRVELDLLLSFFRALDGYAALPA